MCKCFLWFKVQNPSVLSRFPSDVTQLVGSNLRLKSVKVQNLQEEANVTLASAAADVVSDTSFCLNVNI